MPGAVPPTEHRSEARLSLCEDVTITCEKSARRFRQRNHDRACNLCPRLRASTASSECRSSSLIPTRPAKNRAIRERRHRGRRSRGALAAESLRERMLQFCVKIRLLPTHCSLEITTAIFLGTRRIFSAGLVFRGVARRLNAHFQCPKAVCHSAQPSPSGPWAFASQSIVITGAIVE